MMVNRMPCCMDAVLFVVPSTDCYRAPREITNVGIML